MHVTVIAKAPVAGQVKTRLCPPCTFEEAAHVAAAALADTLTAVDRVAAITGARRVLLLEGDRQPWMPEQFEVVEQRGGGLEERLRNGFLDLGAGVIIGMETPHVAASLVEAVAAARRGVDTLGLATDGGYWMVGLCAASAVFAAELFDGVPMSGSDTGLAQLRRMHACGRQVRLLPMARDLDTIDDLWAVAAAGRGGLLAAAAELVLDRRD
ncbi:MAG: DUF2064 domain-containing protein [Actinomycetota bacterium]|nr:DUF2064 domain-containing protein [Actinomycetota bacterium]